MKTTITLTELKQLLHNKENIMVIDVRGKDDYMKNHIPFAGNVPIEIIEAGKV